MELYPYFYLVGVRPLVCGVLVVFLGLLDCENFGEENSCVNVGKGFKDSNEKRSKKWKT